MKVIAIPDLHAPFHDEDKVKRAIKLVKEIKPDVVIQLGDATDQFSASKYPRDPSSVPYTPEQEHTAAMNFLTWFWASVKQAAPKAKLYQINDANHDLRILKRIMERSPDQAFVARQWYANEIAKLGAQPVESEIVIDGAVYIHGFQTGGTHMDIFKSNVVTGHTHKALIKYGSSLSGSYWEMNCGYLGNAKSPVFSYRASRLVHGTNSGIGVIDSGQPRFISLD